MPACAERGEGKMEKGFREKSFYRYKFLSDCLPIYALYTVLFREKGLSVAEIALLLSFWSFIVLLLELPSGIMADRWNRKNMLLIATVLKAVCYLLWYFSNAFAMFGLGFLFWGIACAFTSGTEEGLIYDQLKSGNRESEFGGIYGRGRFFATLGVLAAILSGGMLANWMSIGAISVLSAVLCGINIVFVCRLKEKNFYSQRAKEEKIGYLKTFLDAAKLCAKNRVILAGIVFLVFVVGVTDYLDEYDALVIDDFQSGYIWISVILTVRFLSVAAGNRVAPIVKGRLKSKYGGFLLAMAASLFLLLFSLAWRQCAIPALGAACFIMTVTDVLQIDRIQSEIGEEGRATVMSIYSMAQNAVMILFSLAYALLSSVYDLRTVYIIISIYCVTGAAALLGVRRMAGK